MAERTAVVRLTDLGRCDYAAAWALQRELVARRKAGQGEDRLLVVEHPAVLTLGRRADPAHVLADPAFLAARGVAVHPVERGGDVTYHGPGQLVAYPILDLRGHRKDVRWYSAALCQVAIDTLAAFGVDAHARAGAETGVWVADPHDPSAPPAKIAQIGVRIEQWVTYHGLALNVDPDLAAFDWIVPCGLPGVRTTSLAACLGRPVPLDAVRPVLADAFAAVFGVELAPASGPRAGDAPGDPGIPAGASPTLPPPRAAMAKAPSGAVPAPLPAAAGIP